MPRKVIDPGPFRFSQIHGPRRSLHERQDVGRLLKRQGDRPAQAQFQLEEVPSIEVIESLIVEAHVERGLHEAGVFEYEAWRADGAPNAPLRKLFDSIDRARRIETPRFTPRLNELEALYASGVAIEPLVAKERDFALSSGNKALILLDGRKRVFAATRAGVERLPIYVLL